MGTNRKYRSHLLDVCRPDSAERLVLIPENSSNTLELAQEAGVKANAVWYAVKRRARRAGISNLAPHDLRRTCTRLCHDCCGEVE